VRGIILNLHPYRWPGGLPAGVPSIWCVGKLSRNLHEATPLSLPLLSSKPLTRVIQVTALNRRCAQGLWHTGTAETMAASD
jgi:hypothetical protein